MIYYDLGERVEASSTNIGDKINDNDIVMPEYQAHSTMLAVIPDDFGHTFGVDALVTDRPGIRIGVRTADCVPVLLYDGSKNVVAAIHSGWKGTVGGIIPKVIASIIDRYGCDTGDIKAVIAPCIHLEAFEVGDEVYQAFADSGYAAYAHRMTMPGEPQSLVKWHIDLAGVCRAQLSSVGVCDVYVSPYCTYRCHDRFYSYRYSKCADKTQRIITSIMLKPS